MNKKIFFIFIPITITIVVGFAVMLLWNWLMPFIFGLKTITFFQAIGLFILARILVGGFGFNKNRNHFTKAKWNEKMMKMSPEEREQFKTEWKKRCH